MPFLDVIVNPMEELLNPNTFPWVAIAAAAVIAVVVVLLIVRNKRK